MASPETAVVDYLKWREEREVWAELKGFNRESQEALEGRFRVVEAVGREGILIEDELGRTLEVSHRGQVVAYRVRAYPGEAIRLREYRLDLSGRLLGDLLASLPRQVWVTGALEAATDPPPLVSPVGTYPRVRVSGRAVELHAARPEDLTPLAAVYARAGNLIVRAEFKPGQEASLALPPLPATPQVHPVLIEGLPSLAGLLVQPGDRVEEGEPIARYVDDAPCRTWRSRPRPSGRRRRALKGELTRLQERHQAEREALKGEIARARGDRDRLRYLVSQGAEPRLRLAEAEGKVGDLEAKLAQLLLDYTSERARLMEQAREARLERRKGREAERQLVRSPVAGQVVEVKVRDVGPKGVTVEVVVLSLKASR